MEDKLWQLLRETLEVKYSGAFDIMNNSQEMICELLSDITTYDKDKLNAAINDYWNEAMNAFNCRLEKQDKIIDRFFDTNFKELRLKATLGFYNKEAATNE